MNTWGIAAWGAISTCKLVERTGSSVIGSHSDFALAERILARSVVCSQESRVAAGGIYQIEDEKFDIRRYSSEFINRSPRSRQRKRQTKRPVVHRLEPSSKFVLWLWTAVPRYWKAAERVAQRTVFNPGPQ